MAAEEVKFVFSMDDQFSKQAKQAESNVSGLESKLNTLGTAVIGAFSIGAVVNFGKSVVDAYGKMEAFKVSLTTMLHGNVNEAEALNNQLIQIAKFAPAYGLSEIQDAARQLIAFGSEAGIVGDELMTLGNVASGIGAPLKDVAYLYGTIRTQGRAMTVDINQFANRGIPIWSELAKLTGKNGLELRKFVEEGKVGFGTIEQIFKNMTSAGGQFAGLMAAQANTVNGQLSALGDSWEQLKVSIGESQAGLIKGTVSWASSFVSSIGNVMSGLNKMDAAFKQSGKDIDYTFMQKFNNFLFMGSTNGLINDLFTGGKGRMDMLQRSIESLYINPAQKNAVSAHESQAALARFASNYIAEFRKGQIPKDEYERGLALIKYAQKQISGTIDLMKSKETAKTNGSATTTDKQADKLKTPHYTQITINIDQMTGVETIEVDKKEEIGQNIGEVILKEMVKAVTDSQIVAGASK